MKLSILLISLTLSFALINQSFSQNTGLSVTPEKAEIRNYENTKVPAFIKIPSDQAFPVDGFESYIRYRFGLQNETGFKYISTEKDNMGMLHYRYQQTYKNVPVEKTMYILHTRNGKVESMNGLVFDKISASTEIRFTEAEALEMLLSEINAEVYKWQMPGENEFLKELTGNPDATYYPKGELVFIQTNADFKSPKVVIAYKFNVYCEKPLSRAYYYVDAFTGKQLYKENIIRFVNVQGTAQTKFSGNQTITTDSTAPGNYRLRDSGRGNGIWTLNLQKGTNYNNAVDFTDTDNFWNNVNAERDEFATDAHWGAEMTYDYFFNTFGRNSLDNNGFRLRSYLHYSVNFSNAFWNGQFMTYGDGNTTIMPFVALDIISHEMTHGLTSFTAGLSGNDGDALNESFSDIFGNMVEYYAKPSSASWLLGDEIGNTIRNMANPKALQDPNTYYGQYWDSVNFESHKNSTVQSFWFYILCMGKSGTNDLNHTYNVTGIGREKASAIAYRNLTVYLFPAADYYDSRYFSAKAASDLYGECSQEVTSVLKAWYAVGIGTDGREASFEAVQTSSCAPPFTVNFINKSDAFTAFQWYFGDGFSSTDTNPSHTYTKYGTFDVKLKAISNCGNDSITLNAYIKVDSALSCDFLMPKTTTNQVIEICKGKLYDDGGKDKNYTGNLDVTTTISPPGSSYITLKFKSFRFEGNCDCDWLYIYDGSDINAPLIGKYSGFDLPNSDGIVSSTGSAITIRQYTDPAKTFSGFELDWECSLPNTPPVTDFTTLVRTSCTGIISFKDLSKNAPSSWFWEFGDGDTSTKKNPTHVYQQPGFYTVTLTTTNNYGTTEKEKTDFIEITRPASPVFSSVSACQPSSFVLTAQSSNEIFWYKNYQDTIPLTVGDSFTTPLLSTTTDYFLESKSVPSPKHTGYSDNTFGTGGNYNNTPFQGLIFDCYKPVVLKTVKVYAQGAGNRTINLKNSSGTVILSKTVNIPDGMQIVTLDFNIPVANGLTLGCEFPANLYRNNSGANYPIELPGIIKLTKTTATDLGYPNYYYYFYDWVVQEAACISTREKITAFINTSSPTADFNYSVSYLKASFFDNSVNPGQKIWYFGDGTKSTFESPVHIYSKDGEYEVKLVVDNGCGKDSITKTISVANSIESNFENNLDFEVFPVPANNYLMVKINSNYSRIRIISQIGQEILSQQTDKPLVQINTSELPAGLYYIEVSSQNSKSGKKIIIEHP